MRILTGVAVLGILLLLGTSPGHATPHTFTATLDGASEFPSPNNSTATGFASVILDDALHTLDFNLTFSGLTALATAGTMHCCVAPPSNIFLAMPPFPGFPFATSGIYFHTFDTTLPSTFTSGFLSFNGGGTAAGAETALLLGLQAGEAYFNIHNSQFPAGEIRGNFAQVPEASTLLLLGSGLVGLAAWRWKQRAC